MQKSKILYHNVDHDVLGNREKHTILLETLVPLGTLIPSQGETVFFVDHEGRADLSNVSGGRLIQELASRKSGR
jgi:hypothetical protein